MARTNTTLSTNPRHSESLVLMPACLLIHFVTHVEGPVFMQLHLHILQPSNTRPSSCPPILFPNPRTRNLPVVTLFNSYLKFFVLGQEIELQGPGR